MGKLEQLESQSFPIRIERHKSSGWYFVSCDAISGLAVFGPDLEQLLSDLEDAGFDILRDRGVNILSLKVESITEAPINNDWGKPEYQLRAA